MSVQSNMKMIFARRNPLTPWVGIVYKPNIRFLHKTFVVECQTVSEKVKLSYQQLDIPLDSDLTKVRNRYISLAKKYHPDSNAPSADPEKFTQLQQAYKTIEIHMKSTNTQGNESADEVEIFTAEELRIYTSDYIPMQHRQYLNFGGVGRGSPGQRERQYQKYRASRAVENVSSHRVSKHVSKHENALTVKDKIASKRNKSTNVIERLVEDLVQESMAKGDFDNLPGKGKPLPDRTAHCPHLDSRTHILNEVLANNGYVPEFMSQEREIKFHLVDLRNQLFRDRCKLGKEPFNSFNRKKWQTLQDDFREKMKLVNKMIDNYNLIVPLLRLQMFHFNVEKELERVKEQYREYERREEKRANESLVLVEDLDMKPSLFDALVKIFNKSIFKQRME